MRLGLAVTILILVVSVEGCANNAVYFYETEKMSMTVEARPDPSQPVQGNLGLKQRVILVAPTKKDDLRPSQSVKGETVPDVKSESGDSVSVLGSTRFSKSPVPGSPRVGAFLIQSVLLTGDAAECAVPNSSDSDCLKGTPKIAKVDKSVGAVGNVVVGTSAPTLEAAPTAPSAPVGADAGPILEPPTAPAKAADEKAPAQPMSTPISEVLVEATQLQASRQKTTQTAKIISQTNKSFTQEIADGIISKARANQRLPDLLNAVAANDSTALEDLTGVEKGAYTNKLHDTLRKKLEIDR